MKALQYGTLPINFAQVCQTLAKYKIQFGSSEAKGLTTSHLYTQLDPFVPKLMSYIRDWRQMTKVKVKVKVVVGDLIFFGKGSMR